MLYPNIVHQVPLLKETSLKTKHKPIKQKLYLKKFSKEMFKF